VVTPIGEMSEAQTRLNSPSFTSSHNQASKLTFRAFCSRK